MSLQKNWGWFLVLGIALIVVGAIAMSTPFVGLTAEITVIMFGVLFLIGSGAQLANAVWAWGWRGFFVHLLAGIMYLIVGIFLLEDVGRGIVVLTLMLAVFLIVEGVLLIAGSLTEHYDNWGWDLLGGCITLLLGIFLWRHWPGDAYWVIGLFVGIDLIFRGWAWVMLALVVKQAGPTQSSPQTPV
jgi:uncharacterized membrane protein HdeD (DUF308 family)